MSAATQPGEPIDQLASVNERNRFAFLAHFAELWPNLGDGDVRKAAYRGG